MADYSIEVSVPSVGPQGAIGPTGPANTLTVGTVTTGAAGSSAAATVTGTAPSQTLNLTIPRGDTGATGSQGIQGATGESGTTTIAQVDALMSRSYFRDFATHKNLNDHGTGPAITFTRGSAGTYFDANGTLQTASTDVPRFDHDPATGASRGLLIEEARTNLLASSKTFSGFSGGGWASVTDDHSASPDGTTTASLFEWSVVANSYKLGSTDITTAAAATYTATAFVKPVSGTGLMGVRVGRNDGSQFVESRLNLQTGANTSLTFGADVSGAVVSVQSAGNGWYRLSATGTFSNAYVNFSAQLVAVSGSGSFLVWGAQLEAGAFPTSYIPTTSAAVPRSADSAVVTPISSFYNASEGTLFAEAIAATANGTASGIHQQTVVQLLENNAGDILAAIYRPNGTTDGSFFVGTAGGTQANLAQAGFTAGANTRLAAAYKTDDLALSVNGTAAATDTLGSLPTATTLRIGRYGTSSGFLNGHIRKVAYFPKRLSNALLEQLTT